MRSTAAFVCVLAVFSANIALAAPRGEPKFSRSQLIEDFRIARAALEEAHPGIYRFTPKADLDRTFDAAEARLDHPMDAWEFYRVLQPAVVSLHCGHTTAVLPESLQRVISTSLPLIPVSVRLLGGRIYVVRDLGSRNGRLVGREIVAVNGVPASRIVSTFRFGLPHDGDVQTSLGSRISGWRFGGNLKRFFDLKSPYRLELRDDAGRREIVALDGMNVPQLDSALAVRYPGDVDVAPLGELEFLDGGAIARLKIRRFRGTVDDSGRVSMADFIRQSFDSIHARGSEGLVLDLRDNGGGIDMLGKLVLSYLARGPFEYYDDLVLKAVQFSFANRAEIDSIPLDGVEHRADGTYHLFGHPNWGRQQPSTPHFAGRVMVLANGGSYSTTCELMSHLRSLELATFIGEESGGSYVGNSSGFDAVLRLPHTGLRVNIPLMRYDLAVTPSPRGTHGIMPDVPVTYTIADVLAGTDKELAAALERLR